MISEVAVAVATIVPPASKVEGLDLEVGSLHFILLLAALIEADPVATVLAPVEVAVPRELLVNHGLLVASCSARATRANNFKVPQATVTSAVEIQAGAV